MLPTILQEQHTLYARLPSDGVKLVQPIIETTGASTTASEMLKDLQKEGMKAALFDSLYKFIGYTEGVKRQTYPDTKNYLTIGIGLNLAPHVHSDSAFEAIFTASFNPSRKWDVKTIRTTKNWPTRGLGDDEIRKLFLYSLIGVTNTKGTFVGLMPQFIARLKDSKVDFRNTPFPAYQLIAMQSMAFNSPALIGEGMLSALQTLVQTHGDLRALINILEYSNGGLDVGLQNRRLKEIALFHGKAVDSHLDVQLTVQQYQKFVDQSIPFSLVGGPVIWGLPTGNEQESFAGGSTVEIVPGSDNPSHLDTTTFGSNTADKLVASTGRTVIFGGDGDDELVVSGDNEFAYLAGNGGNNVYNITGGSGIVFLYDVNRKGHIIHGGKKIQGIFDYGTADTGHLILNEYILHRKLNSDGTYWLTMGFDGSSRIIVPNYVNGQFDILWSQFNDYAYEYYDLLSLAGLRDGNTVVYAYEQLNNISKIDVRNGPGKTIKHITVDESDKSDLQINFVTVLPNEKGEFGVWKSFSRLYGSGTYLRHITSNGEINQPFACVDPTQEAGEVRFEIQFPNFNPDYRCAQFSDCINCQPPFEYSIKLDKIYSIKVQQSYNGKSKDGYAIARHQNKYLSSDYSLRLSLFKGPKLVRTTQDISQGFGWMEYSWDAADNKGFSFVFRTWAAMKHESPSFTTIYYEPIVYELEDQVKDQGGSRAIVEELETTIEQVKPKQKEKEVVEPTSQTKTETSQKPPKPEFVQTSSATRTSTPWLVPSAIFGFISSAYNTAHNYLMGAQTIGSAATVPSQPLPPVGDDVGASSAPETSSRDEKSQPTQGRSHKSSTFAQPLSLNDWLIVFQYLSYYVKKYSPITLPWNQERDLSTEELAGIRDLKVKIQQYAKTIVEQRPSLAGKLGFFQDKYDFVDKRLKQLPKILSNVIRCKRASSSELSEIRDCVDSIKEAIHDLAVKNKALKQLRIKERRVLRKDLRRTGREPRSGVVHYEQITGRLTEEFITQEEVFDRRFLGQTQNSSQQFWSHPTATHQSGILGQIDAPITGPLLLPAPTKR